MNEEISNTLHARAEGEVPIERLLGAVHTGVRRRRRRVALTAGAAAVVVALAGATGVVLTPQRPDAVATPAIGSPAPRPPSAEGVPGDDPTLFGLDFTDVDALTHVSWSARSDGQQELALTTESGAEVLVEANRDPGRLTPLDGATSAVAVAGRPATAAAAGGSQLVRWQPRPGLWAQVKAGTGLAAAIGFAAGLSVDRVHRCAVPFRIGGMEAARVRKCATSFTRDDATARWVPSGGVWFTVGADDTEYQVEAVHRTDPRVVADRTLGDRAVEVVEPSGRTDDGPARSEVRYPYDGWTAYLWSFGAARPAELLSLVAWYRPVTSDDQRSWPRSPFA